MSHAKMIAEAVRASVHFAVLSNSFADDADDVDAVGRVTSSWDDLFAIALSLMDCMAR